MKSSFKELSFRELIQKREELKKQYFDLRFKTVVGHLDNPLEKRTLRRKISQLNNRIYNHPDVAGVQE